MTSPAMVLQQAVYPILDADPDITVPIYDHVPDAAVMPYVTIGEAITTPNDAHNHVGYRHSFVLNVWTRDVAGGPRGWKTALTIAAHIDDALNRQTIVTSLGPVHLILDTVETLRDPDPQIRRVRIVARTPIVQR